MSAFLLAVALKATVILALAALVDGLVLRRRASAAARHLLWCFALGGVLLLPVLGAVLPGWSVPLAVLQAPRATGAQEAVAPMAQEPGRVCAVSDGAGPAPVAGPGAVPLVTLAEAPATARVTASVAEPAPWADEPISLPSGGTLLLALYFAIAGVLLVKVAAEQCLVRRLAWSAAPVDDPEWDALLRSVCATLGVRRPVTLLRSDAPTIPLTWGFLRPAVLVPAEAEGWTEARRRAVLLHEVAHVARHDCLTQMLASVACALYWPHPGAWWAAARMRVEREMACDDLALARGVRPREYAGHLLELARGLVAPGGVASVAVPMATPSHLESRLCAVIDATRVRTVPGARGRLIGAAATAALLVPVAVVRPGEARAVAPAAVQARPVAGPVSAPAPVPAAAGVAPVPQEDAGTWIVRPATPEEAGGDGPAVHVRVNVRGLTTFVVPLRRMEGLTAAQLASSGDSARFRLRPDGGTFDFRGTFRGGRGTGRFGFAADPAFVAELARLGIAAPTPRQHFSLALHDVSFELLDELAKQGYAPPAPAALASLGVSGADLRYLREVGALGYRFGTTGALVSFANSGVTPEYIRAVAGLGYRALPADDLVRLRNHSIGADAIRALNERAGRRLTVAELVAARMNGAIPATPAPALASLGRPAPAAAPSPEPEPAPSASTPLSGKWVISGTRDGFANLRLNWDDGTNWDRWVRISALRGTSAEQIGSASPVVVSFRIEEDGGTLELDGSFSGGRGTGPLRFRPNRAFGSTLRSLGLDGAESVSDHQLKNLVWGGVSEDDIRAFRAAGVTPLALRDVIDLAIFQVTPEYARELAALGYRGLSAAQLISLWRARVTPGFVRVVRQSRGEGTPPDSLVALRRRVGG
jgi:beta-lactamase regulating signal transducer with metallopeptidase domain